MKLERKTLAERKPLFTINNPWIITPEYIDDYRNHLNSSRVVAIFERERLGILSKEQMLQHGVLAVVTEQHPRYMAQVYEGDKVNVGTSLYVKRQRLYFMQEMHRGKALVVDNLVEAFMINGNERPTRIPPELLQELERYNQP